MLNIKFAVFENMLLERTGLVLKNKKKIIEIRPL